MLGSGVVTGSLSWVPGGRLPFGCVIGQTKPFGVAALPRPGAGTSVLILQLKATANKIMRTAQRSAGETCLNVDANQPAFACRMFLSLSSNAAANCESAWVCSAT